MKYDIFFSISQTEVDGFLPTEKQLFDQFFDQVQWADKLGYETAWVAETHLSTETQKTNKNPVVPHFKGEIGLNTDILQLCHKAWSVTKNINMGSAIRNIMCNGGPLAHAEAIRYFLSLCNYGLPTEAQGRKLFLGFASGRFDFSNAPYGVRPRNAYEEAAWPVVKSKALRQATEIFLRALKGEEFSSADIKPMILREKDFRKAQEWQVTQKAFGSITDAIELAAYWEFEKLSVIPKECPLNQLQLVIGSHDPELQKMANKYLPVRVFNLSITSPEVIEATHERMRESYHPEGGGWQREYMPRTAMVYLDAKDEVRAKQEAASAWENYWRAIDGTLDKQKVEKAVSNTLAGTPEQVAELIREKYHQDDRVMLWFDFNTHDNERIKEKMQLFMEEVKPLLP